MIVFCVLYGLIVLLMVPADAATLSFDGAQHFHVNLDSVSRTAAEDWRLRFRTSKSSGLIFSSMPEGQHSGRVELGLDAGRLRFTQYSIDRPKVSLHTTMLALCLMFDYDALSQTWYLGQGLNDNQWHRVSISRRGSAFRMAVDDEMPIQGLRFFHSLNNDH